MSQSSERDNAPTIEMSPERRNLVPSGSRDAYSRHIAALVDMAGDEIRNKAASEPYVQAFMDSLLRGIQENDRTCMNGYMKLMKLVDAERTLVIEIWNRLGVRDAGEAQVLVDRAKSAGSQSPRDAAETCVRYLEAYFQNEPAERAHYASRMGLVEQVGGERV